MDRILISESNKQFKGPEGFEIILKLIIKKTFPRVNVLKWDEIYKKDLLKFQKIF